jgi:hypothetical protein
MEDFINDAATGIMAKFENWDMFDGLSKKEIESIKADLVRLQKEALHEFKKKINSI